MQLLPGKDPALICPSLSLSIVRSVSCFVICPYKACKHGHFARAAPTSELGTKLKQETWQNHSAKDAQAELNYYYDL